MTTIEQTPFIDIDVLKMNIDNYKLFRSLDQVQYEIELKEWLPKWYKKTLKVKAMWNKVAEGNF
jgi:hypothetical protein